MRLAQLYLRSRLIGRTVAVLGATAGLTWLWLQWSRQSTLTIDMLPVSMPLAAAVVIGASTGSPFGEIEVTASRSLASIRLWHLAGLLLLATMALALPVVWWSVPEAKWLLVRNLLGFTGLALITARLLGGGLCWVLPLGYAILSMLAYQPREEIQWAWPVVAAGDSGASIFAASLLLVGLALIIGRGARDTDGQVV